MSAPRQPLSSIYLDRQRVGLLGDPRPRVSKVLAASGTGLGDLRVCRARTLDDTDGEDLGLEQVIDRTSRPTEPIYLVLAPPAAATSRPQAQRPGRPARARRLVAFPNPGSPLPRLHPVGPARPASGPYASRPVGPEDAAGVRRG